MLFWGPSTTLPRRLLVCEGRWIPRPPPTTKSYFKKIHKALKKICTNSGISFNIKINQRSAMRGRGKINRRRWKEHYQRLPEDSSPDKKWTIAKTWALSEKPPTDITSRPLVRLHTYLTCLWGLLVETQPQVWIEHGYLSADIMRVLVPIDCACESFFEPSRVQRSEN